MSQVIEKLKTTKNLNTSRIWKSLPNNYHSLTEGFLKRPRNISFMYMNKESVEKLTLFFQSTTKNFLQTKLCTLNEVGHSLQRLISCQMWQPSYIRSCKSTDVIADIESLSSIWIVCSSQIQVQVTQYIFAPSNLVACFNVAGNLVLLFQAFQAIVSTTNIMNLNDKRKEILQ